VPRYNESSIITPEITKYLTINSAVIRHPSTGPGSIAFSEVERIVANGVLLSEKPTTRRLVTYLGDSASTIPYINPDTYEQVLDANGDTVPGHTFTDQEFAFFVSCAYIHAAKQFDLAAQSE
jgi:Zn/Cd-binding protein ZinT